MPDRVARVGDRPVRTPPRVQLLPELSVGSGSAVGTSASVPAGLLRAVRPRQWVKNVLVAAAPLAAGRLAQLEVAGAVLVAFVSFCLVSSAVYLVNDVRDVEEDRRHPTKCLRPIAAGVVGPRLALAAAGVALAAGLATSLLARPALTATLALYAATSFAYSLWLKDQPVIDLAVVAAGFLLRATAGGAAAGVPLSQWFLLVAAFGSLFMVSGKRYSELRVLGPAAGTRRSLHRYSESYLRFVWSLSAGVSLTAYGLWAFEVHAAEAGLNWAAFSIVPFVLGLLRYAVDVDAGAAGEPEDIVLRDRVLQLVGGVWLVLLTAGVVGAG